MSDPTDIKALDEYLKGDSDVSRRYRELGRDEVPPELDRRVLAAAREAVADEGTKRSRSWLRWSAPVALAASVVLVVTVVLERGVQDETVLLPPSPGDIRPVRSDVASDDKAANAAAQEKLAEEKRADEVVRQQGLVREPAAQPPAPASVAKAEAERSSNLDNFAPPPEITVEAQALPGPAQAAEQTTPVTVVPEAPAVAPPEPLPVETISARKSVERSEADADSSAGIGEVVVTGRARRAPGRTAGPRNTISERALSSESRTFSEQRERSDPEEWLEDIRDLRRAGKSDEADREWQRFREAFPEFRVADDDVARKK